ncbi:PspC domain-containing protein [Pseudonocardia saturnea]
MRSRRDGVLGGCAGASPGLLGVDPLLLRVAAAALALSGGVGVVAYIVAWVIIPEAGHDEPEVAPRRADRHTSALVAGAALVGLSALLLLRTYAPWFGEEAFWPLVVGAVGAVVIVSGRR